MGTDQMQPMTMQQVADEMRLNTSTVSRAVKDKYIQFQTRLIPLRSLFSSSLQGDDGSLVSADAAFHPCGRSRRAPVGRGSDGGAGVGGRSHLPAHGGQIPCGAEHPHGGGAKAGQPK